MTYKWMCLFDSRRLHQFFARKVLIINLSNVKGEPLATCPSKPNPSKVFTELLLLFFFEATKGLTGEVWANFFMDETKS